MNKMKIISITLKHYFVVDWKEGYHINFLKLLNNLKRLLGFLTASHCMQVGLKQYIQTRDFTGASKPNSYIPNSTNTLDIFETYSRYNFTKHRILELTTST